MHPDKFLGIDNSEQEAIKQEDKDNKFAALCRALCEKREEAINAKRESGIEDIWTMCEEANAGIDDANRNQIGSAQWDKPTSMSGGLQRFKAVQDNTKSTMFVPMAKRYIDNASAKLSEIILSPFSEPFRIEPTPIPDLVEIGDHEQVKPKPPEMPQQMPGMPPATQAQPEIVDKQKEEIAKAKKSADKAQERLYDWLAEGGYSRQARRVIYDAARLGCGVLKGPFAKMKKSKSASKDKQSLQIEIKYDLVPSVEWVSPWNFYPAPGCGEDFKNGDFLFQKDDISSKTLKDLASPGLGYIEKNIQAVLKEGPNKCLVDPKKSTPEFKTSQYEIWYFYGQISKEDLASADVQDLEDVDVDDIYAIVTMVNDTVIRAVVNPLDSGDYPFQVMKWSDRPNSWAGIGVCEPILAPQRMVNAGTRSMLNNAGLSSGVQIVMDRNIIEPADGKWTITPNKIWNASGEAGDIDVRKAMNIITYPSVFENMMGVITYAERIAEEVSGIPLVTQGQQGPYSPETFGQAELQNNNALTWLRSVGYRFDEDMTKPLIDKMYEWLLLDPNVPDDEKGDFNVICNGSSVTIERAIQENVLMGLLGASANPAFNVNPEKVFAEYVRTKNLDPEKLQYTKEEQEERAKIQQPPPPQIQAAQIRAEADAKKTQAMLQADQQKTQALLQAEQQKTQAELQMEREIAQLESQTTMQRAQVDTDRDTVYVQAQDRKNQNDAEARMQELQVKRELALLEYANREKINLDQVKADLAKESMKLQTQKELSAASMEMDVKSGKVSPQIATPPTEPSGRADNGRAYEQ